ncbi:helical backbone metal receptor [Streptomyces sp. NPDC003401]
MTDRIAALAPDLVIADEEENREPGLSALRDAGTEVLVTECATCRRPSGSRPAYRRSAGPAHARAGSTTPRRPGAPRGRPDPCRPAVVPVRRRPWTVPGRDTFAGDVPARLGVDHPHTRTPAHRDRHPEVTARELRAAAPDLVVLPDEPYRFTADDGPQALPGLPCALVSGRRPTWYGPSLTEAPRVPAGRCEQLTADQPPHGARGTSGAGTADRGGARARPRGRGRGGGGAGEGAGRTAVTVIPPSRPRTPATRDDVSMRA